MVRKTVLLAAFALLSTVSHVAAAPTPRVTRVHIKKKDHTLTLMTKAKDGTEEVLASYHVAIGPGGLGPKRREGDMTTPVGRYKVTMQQPSQYKVFLRLDYPNAEDWKRFTELKRLGALPDKATIGGDIGIHGPPVSYPAPESDSLNERDWTAGCIAVDDHEITEIAKRVPVGTPVDIED